MRNTAIRFYKYFVGVAAGMLLIASGVTAQEVLPFPDPPMGGEVGPTMQESVHKWRETPRHLPEDAPHILIVMLDDAGFGQAATFGGEIATPTLSRLANEGISYNAFHTVAMCSPTRAALMTGRNHNRVGFGQIAELANDWDGYTGIIPKSSATIAEVLGHLPRLLSIRRALVRRWSASPPPPGSADRPPPPRSLRRRRLRVEPRLGAAAAGGDDPALRRLRPGAAGPIPR